MSRLRVRLFRVTDDLRNLLPANDTSGKHTGSNSPAKESDTPLPTRPSHRERAQTLCDHRRNRRRWFGERAAAFQESAWDILLELFLCHEDGRTPSTTSVAYGAGVPITTALRSLKKLQTHGLVESRMDDVDTRVRKVFMTQEAIVSMRGYLDDI